MSLFGRKEKQEIERLKAQMNPQQIEAADLEGRMWNWGEYEIIMDYKLSSPRYL